MSEQAVQIRCPNLLCRKVLAVPTSARGKTVRCKSCQTMIRVPNGPSSSSSSAATGKKPGNAA